MRRSQDKVKLPTLSNDPQTGEVHIRHHMTPDGFYRGIQYRNTKSVDTDETPQEESEKA